MCRVVSRTAVPALSPAFPSLPPPPPAPFTCTLSSPTVVLSSTGVSDRQEEGDRRATRSGRGGGERGAQTQQGGPRRKRNRVARVRKSAVTGSDTAVLLIVLTPGRKDCGTIAYFVVSIFFGLFLLPLLLLLQPLSNVERLYDSPRIISLAHWQRVAYSASQAVFFRSETPWYLAQRIVSTAVPPPPSRMLTTPNHTIHSM